jgi:hypothetical protein
VLQETLTTGDSGEKQPHRTNNLERDETNGDEINQENGNDNGLMETLDGNVSPAQSTAERQQHSPSQHPTAQHQSLPTYLFLSKTDSTVILQMGSEISELEKDSTAFCTKHPTILCANLCNNKYILQVTTNAFYLYKTITSLPQMSGEDETEPEISGPSLVTTFDLVDKLDARIRSAQLLDRFVGVLTENGKMLVYEFVDRQRENDDDDDDMNESTPAFCLISPSLNNSTSAISCFSLYKDERYGLLSNELLAKTSETAVNEQLVAAQNILANRSTNVDEEDNRHQETVKTNGESSDAKINIKTGSGSGINDIMESVMNVDDDEDEMLYGATGASTNLLDGSGYSDDLTAELKSSQANLGNQLGASNLNETRGEQDEAARFGF